MKSLFAAAWLLTLSSLLGCTTTRAIATQELVRLNGFQPQDIPRGEEPVLQPLEGEPLQFRADSRLFLVLPEGRVGGHFDAIEVKDGVFRGQLAEGPVQIPLDRLREAEVVQTNRGLTALLVGGVILSVVLTGAAFAYMATPKGGGAVEGRALRVRGRLVTAPLAGGDEAPESVLDEGTGWTTPGLNPDLTASSPAAREQRAAIWTARAQAEHASVPAFARLSLNLVALGAPSALIERAHDAAREEIHHARLAFTLASAYAGRPIGPGPLRDILHAPAVTCVDRRRLAEESLVDGVLEEGAAALAAAEELAGATDAAVRAALAIIARDEAAHAELAWSVIAWCLATDADPDELLRTLRRAALRAPAPKASPTRSPDLFERNRADTAARLLSFRKSAAA